MCVQVLLSDKYFLTDLTCQCMHVVAQKSQTRDSQLHICTFLSSELSWKPGRRLSFCSSRRCRFEYGRSRVFIQVYLRTLLVSFSLLPIKKGWLGILSMGRGHHPVDVDRRVQNKQFHTFTIKIGILTTSLMVIVRRTNNFHILQILDFIHPDLCYEFVLFWTNSTDLNIVFSIEINVVSSHLKVLTFWHLIGVG